MPNYEHDKQYVKIVEPILDDDDFSKMKDIQHHNDTRLNHSLKVSYYSYKIAKALRLDYEDVARGGLLHDFYLEQVNDQKSLKDKIILYTTKHPNDALDNASKHFNISEKEKDIIRTHMFPVDVKVPRYAESWIVSMVDKGVSLKEFYQKFSTRVSWVTNLYILTIINFIR